jgi:hypothetical protein
MVEWIIAYSMGERNRSSTRLAASIHGPQSAGLTRLAQSLVSPTKGGSASWQAIC